jgi:hypothetical protein
VAEIGRADGQWYLTSEACEGPDLLTGLQAVIEPAARGESIRRAFGELAAALSALHAHGIVHRDIKPANVRLVDGGCVKLIDFGLAGANGAEDEVWPSSLSANGAPPEVLRGHPWTCAADMWSYGWLLSSLLLAPIYSNRLRDLSLAARRAVLQVLPQHILAGTCIELLDDRPTFRPTAQQLALRFGATPVSSPPGGNATWQGLALPLPSEECSALQLGIDRAARSGQGMCCEVPSCMISRLAELRFHCDEPLVRVSGRQWPGESYDFAAWDDALNSFAGWLARVPPSHRQAWIPANASAMCGWWPRLAHVCGQRNPTDTIGSPTGAIQSLLSLLDAITADRIVLIGCADFDPSDGASRQLMIELRSLANRRPLVLALGR